MGLDVVDLVLAVENEFEITVDNLDAEKIGTVGQLYQYVLLKLYSGPSDEKVWGRLTAIIAEHAGVAQDQVTEEKHFVHDLGMD